MCEVSVLGIGVATLDIYVKQRRMYPGGNEYNVACHAKMLGAKAGFLGVFADDPAGKILEDTLTECGVDVSFSHHEKGSSGYSLVELKEDGDRVFLMWNHEGVTDLYPITFTIEELDYVKSYDVVSIGRCSSVSLDRVRLLAKNGVRLCYDFHAAYTDEDIEAYAPYTTYAFFSCGHLGEEEETKRVLKKAVDLGCKFAVGTSGCDPVIAYDGERYYTQETCRVEATDALGAGDSYIAGVLVHYLKRIKAGRDQEDALREALYQATLHSAHVVQIEGSIGIGYDVDPERVGEIVHLKES